MKLAKYIYKTVVQPDHPVVRDALKAAERIYKANGRPEGITMTSGKEGTHSAGSWHPMGCAFDLRTRYFRPSVREKVYRELKAALPHYDVVLKKDHIHVEPSDSLAKKWRLML